MTEKQERILTVALELFAQQGYAATATSRIAREAGVSEGLIFRHFENKEGLLKAILEYGSKEVNTFNTHLSTYTDPRARLRAILEAPFNFEPQQYHFWRLIYSIKWQMETYDNSMSTTIKEALLEVFEQLAYPDPNAEAELVVAIIDGTMMAMLLRKPENARDILAVLMQKYGV